MTDVSHPAIQRARKLINEISLRVEADLLTCDRCGHSMKVRSTQVQDDPCRNDIRLKCPLPTPANDHDGCGWWTQHGVRIPRDEYEFEMRERDHRLVDAVNTDAEATSVEERMAALGYLDQ